MTLEAGKQKHQQFVDDTILMIHLSIEEARSIKQFLEFFVRASCLDVKEQKISFFLIQYT